MCVPCTDEPRDRGYRPCTRIDVRDITYITMSQRSGVTCVYTGLGDGRFVDGLLSGAADLSDAHPIRALCADARRAFLQQPMLLKLRAPIKVVGDLHGQYGDLLRWFDVAGRPPDVDFLFLGDFVDRGPQSVQVCVAIEKLMMRFPLDNDVYNIILSE